MPQLPRPAGSNYIVDKTLKKMVTVTLYTDSILYNGSPGSGSCSSAVPSAQAALLRLTVLPLSGPVFVFLNHLCILSPLPRKPRMTSCRGSTLDSLRPALHNEPPFSSQRCTERGRIKKKKTYVLPDIKLPISPSFPLICMLRRLCPHPPAATGPPVCRPALKQTHLAHIPQLRRPGLFTVSEPLPEKRECAASRPVNLHGKKETTKSTSLSWF